MNFADYDHDGQATEFFLQRNRYLVGSVQVLWWACLASMSIFRSVGWDHFREKDFRNLKSVYVVSWVVLQKPVAIGFPCPYENPTLEVCRID